MLANVFLVLGSRPPFLPAGVVLVMSNWKHPGQDLSRSLITDPLAHLWNISHVTALGSHVTGNVFPRYGPEPWPRGAVTPPGGWRGKKERKQYMSKAVLRFCLEKQMLLGPMGRSLGPVGHPAWAPGWGSGVNFHWKHAGQCVSSSWFTPPVSARRGRSCNEQLETSCS